MLTDIFSADLTIPPDTVPNIFLMTKLTKIHADGLDESSIAKQESLFFCKAFDWMRVSE